MWGGERTGTEGGGGGAPPRRPALRLAPRHAPPGSPRALGAARAGGRAAPPPRRRRRRRHAPPPPGAQLPARAGDGDEDGGQEWAVGGEECGGGREAGGEAAGRVAAEAGLSAALLLLLLLLLLPLPAGAWYKHVASPRYHTVGRASGLLMGLRRSPYLWRRALGGVVGPLSRDSVVPGPVAGRALLLLSAPAQELWEARRRSWRAGLPVYAPRSPRDLERARQPERSLSLRSWIPAESAR